MWRFTTLLLILVVILLVPVGSADAQATPLVTVTIEESSIQPGENLTVNWVVSSHMRRFDHVKIELSHPVLGRTATFTAKPRTGTLDIPIPENYYDTAVVTVYPEKANNQRYVDAASQTIFARAEAGVDDGVEISQLTITPELVQPGGAVTVSWEVAYGEGDAPAVSLIYPGEEDFYETETGLSPVDSITIPVPIYYTETYGVSLVVEKTLGAAAQTEIACPFATYLGDVCPITQTTATLTYQYFEKGVLLLWGNQIFVLATNPPYRTAYLRNATTADLSAITPPDGLLLPDAALSGVWQANEELLGFATGTAASYSTSLETFPTSSGRHKAIGYWLTLPDGDVISINIMSLTWTAAN